MNGKDLAVAVLAQYKTADVVQLAQKAGCTLVFERWHDTTFGEFHNKTNIICVNLNAPIPQARIIAHELGHFFAKDMPYCKNRAEKERLAEEFALHILAYASQEGS